MMNQVQRAKDRRINNDQNEHRNDNVTRPMPLSRESVTNVHAIRIPITATSGAAMCSHSSRVTRSRPIMCGPISRTASKIDKYIPADANAANQVRTRIANGCFSKDKNSSRLESVSATQCGREFDSFFEWCHFIRERFNPNIGDRRLQGRIISARSQSKGA